MSISFFLYATFLFELRATGFFQRKVLFQKNHLKYSFGCKISILPSIMITQTLFRISWNTDVLKTKWSLVEMAGIETYSFSRGFTFSRTSSFVNSVLSTQKYVQPFQFPYTRCIGTLFIPQTKNPLTRILLFVEMAGIEPACNWDSPNDSTVIVEIEV